MDKHPIQGGEEILLITSCWGNRDKLRPDGPRGLNADFTFFTFIKETRLKQTLSFSLQSNSQFSHLI